MLCTKLSNTLAISRSQRSHNLKFKTYARTSTSVNQFFKLQLDDSNLGVEIPPEAKSELDLSFAKIERMIMESIAASTDRVQIFAALKHLVVTGNALVYMAKRV